MWGDLSLMVRTEMGERLLGPVQVLFKGPVTTPSAPSQLGGDSDRPRAQSCDHEPHTTRPGHQGVPPVTQSLGRGCEESSFPSPGCAGGAWVGCRWWLLRASLWEVVTLLRKRSPGSERGQSRLRLT